MIVTKKFSFDLDTRGISPLMYAVQGEVNTRKVEISLFSNGTAWEIPDGTVVAVAYRKPDGTKGLYDKLPNGESASAVSGNVVTVMLAPQVLTCAGKVMASIIFYSKDMVNTLATFPFQIHVEKNPGAGEQISNNYYYLQNLDQVNAELQGLRVGYDGTKYNTAGEAVRTQLSKLHQNIDSKALKEEILADGTVNIVLSGADSVEAANSDAVSYNIARNTTEPTDITDTLTWTENTYIYFEGGFLTGDSFRYSNLITLNKGETIRMTAAGGSLSVALISKWSSDGNTFIACVNQVSVEKLVETVEHTATETEYLRICYNKYWTTKDGGALVVETFYSGTEEPDVPEEPDNPEVPDDPDIPAGIEVSQINGRNLADKTARQAVEELRLTVEDNKGAEVTEEVLADGTVNIVLSADDSTDDDTVEVTNITDTLTWTENTYINFDNGVFKTADSFRYSNLITLNKGEAIRVTASGGTNSVALISKWNSSGNTFLGCVHQSVGNTVETAEHIAIETEYVRVCYNKYYTTKDGGALVVETYQGSIEIPEDTLAECSQINGRNLVDKGARKITNPLFGKSMCVDGDSITYGQGNLQNGVYKGWADIIAEQNGMTIRKLAKSGATLTSGSNSICNRVSTVTAADYIIISGGYNDYANGVELGELTEQGFRIGTDTIDTFEGKTLDKTKVIDAVEYIVRYLLATYPTKKLGFVFTHKTGGEWYRPKTSQKTHTLKEYHDAILSVLEKYSFPYCDLTQISRFNTGTPTYAANFTNNGDAIHPNQGGYEIGYVPQITAWLKTL